MSTISMLCADDLGQHAAELGALMQACVLDGASIGYVLPFTAQDGEAFWTKAVLPALRKGGRLLLVAWREGLIVGTVQLDFDTPPNQPHRAEVRKLMVHPAYRRQGIAQALMAAVERYAAVLGRSLLTLDTRSGDVAQALYAALGYQVVGMIPGYCRDALSSRLDATTIMYKAMPA